MNLVFHQAALGDFALILPLLRGLESPTTFIGPWSRGRLAARLIPGLQTADIELFEFTRLHSTQGPSTVSPAIAELLGQARHVLNFVARETDPWVRHVQALAPKAQIISLPTRPASSGATATQPVRHMARRWADRLRDAGLELADVPVPVAGDPAGPLVVHPGSGGREKCWPRDRFAAVIDRLREAGRDVRVVLGEAEAERWSAAELAHWQQHHDAAVCTTLTQLLDPLDRAAAYLGNDAGPTHLAAQLGLPTTALFGPTDPRLWAPRGPAVTVLAPDTTQPMTWLSVEKVLSHLTP